MTLNISEASKPRRRARLPHPGFINKRLLGALALAACLFPLSPFAAAASDTPGKTIAGWVEKVTILEDGHLLKAKLDTGAKTSSIHAINIEDFKRDGETWIRFDLIIRNHNESDAEYKTLERPRVRKIRVKEHEGRFDRRPVVELPICFDGRQYIAEFNLVDRSRFLYPVLLGRLFLKGIAVIDPEMTFLTQARCNKPADDTQE